jgi:hypothetical protein
MALITLHAATRNGRHQIAGHPNPRSVTYTPPPAPLTKHFTAYHSRPSAYLDPRVTPTDSCAYYAAACILSLVPWYPVKLPRYAVRDYLMVKHAPKGVNSARNDPWRIVLNELQHFRPSRNMLIV